MRGYIRRIRKEKLHVVSFPFYTHTHTQSHTYTDTDTAQNGILIQQLWFMKDTYHTVQHINCHVRPKCGQKKNVIYFPTPFLFYSHIKTAAAVDA